MTTVGALAHYPQWPRRLRQIIILCKYIYLSIYNGSLKTIISSVTPFKVIYEYVTKSFTINRPIVLMADVKSILIMTIRSI